jgi:hypothetical protein
MARIINFVINDDDSKLTWPSLVAVSRFTTCRDRRSKKMSFQVLSLSLPAKNQTYFNVRIIARKNVFTKQSYMLDFKQTQKCLMHHVTFQLFGQLFS